MRARVVLPFLLLLAACESDLDRLRRLEHEEAMACVPAPRGADYPTVKDAVDRCTLARRELAAFMAKR